MGKNEALVPDTELIKRLKSGDEAAFRIIFDQWFKKLYYFSFRYLKNREYAEEIVQEVMLQLWINREFLEEKYPVSPYLYTITKRLSLNMLRQIATSKTASARIFAGLREAVNTTEEDVSLAELKRITEEALVLMPKQQQQVYRMSRNEGLSLDEIASQLGILKNTVKKHLSEALKAIRKHFSVRYYLFFISLISVLKK